MSQIVAERFSENLAGHGKFILKPNLLGGQTCSIFVYSNHLFDQQKGCITHVLNKIFCYRHVFIDINVGSYENKGIISGQENFSIHGGVSFSSNCNPTFSSPEI